MFNVRSLLSYFDSPCDHGLDELGSFHFLPVFFKNNPSCIYRFPVKETHSCVTHFPFRGLDGMKQHVQLG